MTTEIRDFLNKKLEEYLEVKKQPLNKSQRDYIDGAINTVKVIKAGLEVIFINQQIKEN